LKFKVGDGSTRPSLKLTRTNGFDGPSRSRAEHTFREVTYENKHHPIDFFRSIGRLPTQTLMRAWYLSRDARRSACSDDIFKDEEAWRDRYWNNFYDGITRKLRDWHYEQEYRLILSGMHLDFSNGKDRVTHYDFNDLDGIIFGIMTPANKKRQICKIIEEKCRALNRKNFNFYQACYSPVSGRIEHREMTLLKFDFDGAAAQSNQ
jgi:hypothetical protein